MDFVVYCIANFAICFIYKIPGFMHTRGSVSLTLYAICCWTAVYSLIRVWRYYTRVCGC